LSKWVRLYRDQGEAGLKSKKAGPRRQRSKVAAAVKAQVVELKRHHPDLGIKKISQFLRRVLFLPVSRETVRRTLHEQQLLKKRKPQPQRNPPKPRFFERSTPNQMWQTDIFTFRLGGKNAYLIGFLDDHSRYVVGLDVFRSQTAEHVLEVYRTPIAEYGVPKEMLSDQGRQYCSWRGTRLISTAETATFANLAPNQSYQRDQASAKQQNRAGFGNRYIVTGVREGCGRAIPGHDPARAR